MNREYKFRAWDTKVTQPMLDHEAVLSLLMLQGRVLNGTADDKGRLDRFKIMQYAEYKDKDGEFIYDGDIITINYGIPPKVDRLEVYFYDGCWMTKRHNPTLECPLFDLPSSDLTVIGNVWENPELLET